MKSYAQIVSWGRYVPSKVLTNADLEKMVDTSDDWILSRTGIVERHIADDKESTSTLSIKAARAAIEMADIHPSKIELVIVATVTPDYLFPATSCLVQDALGATQAGALDLNAGCSGFVYGLGMAGGLIAAGQYNNILVIGADTLSRIVDWTDRNTCVLFGDGAGAVLLQATDLPTGVLSSVLGSDGSGGSLLQVPAGGSRHPASQETVQNRLHYMKMAGNEVFKFAVNAMCKSALQAIKDAGLSPDDIDLLIPHQANARIIQSAAKMLKIPGEKVYVNVDRYGNTSAASIPIALCDAISEQRVKTGDHLLLVGFGAGLTWAAAVVRWGVSPLVPTLPWWKTVQYRYWDEVSSARSRLRRVLRRISLLGR